MCPIRVARSSTQAKAPVLVRGSRAQSSARGASPVAVPRAEAICMGFTETSGLRSVSPSSSAVSGLGFRIRERKKRSMIEGMRALLKRGVVSNNALKPTRSPQTAWGPRGLVQCSAGSCEASSKETWK